MSEITKSVDTVRTGMGGDKLVRGEGVAATIDRKAGAAKTETDKSSFGCQRDRDHIFEGGNSCKGGLPKSKVAVTLTFLNSSELVAERVHQCST